jgi:histidine ammonia-lyase
VSVDPDHVVLDGASLTLDQLTRVARDPRVQVACDPAALARVAHGWRQIEALVARYVDARARFERGESSGADYLRALVYGVTTGFGEFKHVPIEPVRLRELQRNLLLSHSVGVGDNADADDLTNYFPAEVLRGALLLRLNAFLKGHSGVRPELVACVQAMLNGGIVPLVPVRGSLGASGDLCPLAHTFAVLLGEGRYYRVAHPDDLLRRAHPLLHARDGLVARDGERIELPDPPVSFKEGLALTNGANFSSAILALAVQDAQNAANTADVAAALTLEAMIGRREALDPRVHRARGHRGQADSAANLRALVEGSALLAEPTTAAQDAYSLRCAPQVHGAARDTVAYARMVAEREINAATDNPLFFAEADGTQRAFSAGNFHGQPIALAADFLAIALAELGDISERRTQMLLDGHHNRGLAPNLIAEQGLNSGYMIAQYTAASLVSENKVLAHPASVDSIPTSANAEDHAAMALIAARKLRAVLGNVQATLGIELLVGAQAVEWRAFRRGHAPVPAGPLPDDFAFADLYERGELRARERASFERASDPAAVGALLGRGTREAYRAVREQARPMFADRPLDDDIRRVRASVATGEIARRAGRAAALREIPALDPGRADDE